ncbi:hypothetical protein [Microbacterium maritypicum]|nr:hypothetical protein [Microbacterium liquefaciens]
MTNTQHTQPSETPGPLAPFLALLDRFDAHLAEFQGAAREEVLA